MDQTPWNKRKSGVCGGGHGPPERMKKRMMNEISVEVAAALNCIKWNDGKAIYVLKEMTKDLATTQNNS